MKKFCCFGSLNLDYVYHLPHFVRSGETLGCTKRDVNAGGKGLNQSCALSHAGAKVYHAGNIGAEGEFLKQTLARHGVHTEYIRTVNKPTGHAVIQVDENGENCIILFGGANQCADEEQMREVLAQFCAGDVLVLQNEINDVGKLMELAKERGMKIAFNPSPIDENIFSLPLALADYLFVNETEGAALSGCKMNDVQEMLSVLGKKYPKTEVVLTLGSKGAAAMVDGMAVFFLCDRIKGRGYHGRRGHFYRILFNGKKRENAGGSGVEACQYRREHHGVKKGCGGFYPDETRAQIGKLNRYYDHDRK